MKIKVIRCRFFVVPHDGPALLGLPNTEILELLKIMCEVLDQHQVGRKYVSWTKEASDTPGSRTYSISNSSLAAPNNCVNILDYSDLALTVKQIRVSRLLTMKIYNDFSDIFTGTSCSEGTFKLQVREGNHPYKALPKKIAYVLQEPVQE